MTASHLIPRERIFGNPECAGVDVNADGTRIAYLAPKDGVLNVFAIDRSQISDMSLARPITNDTDKGGDEDWKVYSVNVVTGNVVCLTPTDKTSSSPNGISNDYPDYMLITSNKRMASSMDVLLVNIHTGEEQLLIENDGEFAVVKVDHKFSSFVVSKMNDDSSIDLSYAKLDTRSKVVKSSKVYSKKVGGVETEHTEQFYKSVVPMISPVKASIAKHVLHIAYEDSGYGDTDVRAFTSDLTSVYIASYRDYNTSAITSFNLSAKEFTYIGSDPKSNIANESLIHPVTHELVAYVTNYDMKRYVAVNPEDEELAADFAALTAEAGTDGEWLIDGVSGDFSTWVVRVTKSDMAPLFYIYERASKKLQLLFNSRPVLAGYKLNKMRAVEITTRDGLNMLAYLTIPKQVAGVDENFTTKPVPLLLIVHGGPYARDEFGFNKAHQFFSDRGYAVIAPQYRGSTGFGKEFLNAATGEWAGKMHDDVIDACNWAVENGITTKEKIGIFGGSYGGYAALVGVTFTPEYFACSVDLVGPSSIATLISTFPTYWGPIRSMFTTRIGGNDDTDEGRSFLWSRSPLSKVDNIVRPLLIGQGANDPRVKQSESDQIFEAMQAKNIPVTYLLYPDEGHGFARPSNNISFYAVMETFLAKHLGGQAEVIGAAFEGSSIEFKGGKEEIGL
ncbi:Alpha/Beta hydrolase protein [Chytriomyces sp. MP71]|nr:Alpha/Beta hydrolase protein [Chytriomyces sp. MP71]